MSTPYAIEREVIAVVARTLTVCAFADYCDEWQETNGKRHPDSAGAGDDWFDCAPEDAAEVNATARELAAAWWWAALVVRYPDVVAALDCYAPDPAPRGDRDPVKAWAHKAAMAAQGHGVYPGDDGETLPTTPGGETIAFMPSVEVYQIQDEWNRHYMSADLPSSYVDDTE
jgi:hypothetical protein